MGEKEKTMIGLIYEWEQTADFITVNVQLPVGISGKLAEIKIGENILNVSLPGNYLLRIYLFGLVIRDSSKVIIKPGNITVNLKVTTLIKHFVYLYVSVIYITEIGHV